MLSVWLHIDQPAYHRRVDLYNVWFDLRPGVRDLEFVKRARAYFGHLREEDKISGYRITRRKLGFGPQGLGEFHVVIEVQNLAELDGAFEYVATRAGQVEGLHASLNQLVTNASFALYRDFPDPTRVTGEERF